MRIWTRSRTPRIRGQPLSSRRSAGRPPRSTRSFRPIARRCRSRFLTSAGCEQLLATGHWSLPTSRSPCLSMGAGLRFPRNPRGTMPSPTPDILRGTLDLLILKALSWGPAHGYAVARWIETATNDGLAVGEGTLYPALHRLEERGWITASWGASENNRQAKFYSLTRKGRTQLRAEADNWRRYAAAIFAALDAPALD